MRHEQHVLIGASAALLAAVLAVPGGVAFSQAGPGIITTVAGENSCFTRDISGKQLLFFGSGGFSGDGGPATSARLSGPWGVAVDTSGSLFIADAQNNRIRRVDGTTGVITTVAGNSVCHSGACTHGFSGDGGPATTAELDHPVCVAVDADGNLFICDPFNARVRRVDHASGVISTVAGNGTKGFSGDGGPATSAELQAPTGAAVDRSGNLFIADSFNNRIRRVDKTTGIITTVAGGGTCCFGVREKDGLATNARLDRPSAVLADASGNLFIAEPLLYNRVRRVDHASGIISTVAGASCPRPFGSCGPAFDGDGGPARDAHLASPQGLAMDAAGNLFIADTGNHRIRRVDHTTGTIATVAGTDGRHFSGDDGPATSAELSFPTGLAVDAKGNLFISDAGANRVLRVEGAPAGNAPGTAQNRSHN
jgi:sugar lactone lactonase YvrE